MITFRASDDKVHWNAPFGLRKDQMTVHLTAIQVPRSPQCREEAQWHPTWHSFDTPSTGGIGPGLEDPLRCASALPGRAGTEGRTGW